MRGSLHPVTPSLIVGLVTTILASVVFMDIAQEISTHHTDEFQEASREITVAPGSGAFELLSIAVVVIVVAVLVVHGISVVISTQLKSTQLQAEYPNVEETKTRYVEGVLSLSEFEDELEQAWDADMSWPDAEDNNE